MIKDRFYKKDSHLYGIGKYRNSLAMLYHANSKLSEFSIKQLGGKIQGFNHPFIDERASRSFKRYPNAKLTSLKEYLNIYNNSKILFEAIKDRSSRKDYNKYKISLLELAQILYFSYGVSRAIENKNITWSFRTVPSGGGLYPLELYVVIFNAHFDVGLYHFRPDICSLELIEKNNFSEKLHSICGTDTYEINLEDVSCIILTTSMIERNYLKYGERGYRFMLMKVGFVAQNMSLVCESLHLNSSMFGGYLDDGINAFLRIDGLRETIQNVMVVGQ